MVLSLSFAVVCQREISSSGFSLSQFVVFLHVTPDRLMMIRSHLCVEHKHLPGLLQLMAK